MANGREIQEELGLRLRENELGIIAYVDDERTLLEKTLNQSDTMMLASIIAHDNQAEAILDNVKTIGINNHVLKVAVGSEIVYPSM